MIEQEKIFLIKLGQKITEFRRIQNLSKVQLAFEINTSESNIRRIEKGQVNVGIVTLLKIADALDITISDLTEIN